MDTILEYVPIIAIVGVLALFGLVLWLLTTSRFRDRSLKKESSVLESASVFVHSVRPSEPPEAAFDDEEEEGRRYYSVDVTITPAAPAAGAGRRAASNWDPFALGLKDPDSGPHASEESCESGDVEVWKGGRFVNQFDALDNPVASEGAQRVRIRVGVLPGVRRLVFVYYLQEFGEVRLP